MDVEEVRKKLNKIFDLIEIIKNGIVEFVQESRYKEVKLSKIYQVFNYNTGLSEIEFEMLYLYPLMDEGRIIKEEDRYYHILYNREYDIKLPKNEGSE